MDYYAYIHDLLMHTFFLFIHQPATLLDFGCGNGLLTSYVQQTFYQAKVVGCDRDSEQVEKNIQEYPELSFVCNSSTVLPFADATFDIVYGVQVIHHIPAQEQRSTVNELLRVLKPGGYLLLIEPNPYNLAERIKFAQEHPKEQRMITHHTLKKLLNNHCTTKTDYLYPHFPYEGMLQKLPWLSFPFAQLYAITAQKKEDA